MFALLLLALAFKNSCWQFRAAGPKTVSNESGAQCMGGVKECMRGVEWMRCAVAGA